MPPPRRRARPPALEWSALILAAAFLVATAFQTEQVIVARSNLATIRHNQAPAMRQGESVRHQLEQLAGATAKLAAQGNANAATVVAEMKRLGVTLHETKKP